MYRYDCSTCRQPGSSSTEQGALDHQAWHHRMAHQEDVPPAEHVYFRRESTRPRVRYVLAPFALGLVIVIVNWVHGLFSNLFG